MIAKKVGTTDIDLPNTTSTGSAWLDTELQGSQFKDLRLGKRLRQLMGDLWSSVGMSIPFAGQDWANTKAAYRFLDNSNVNEAEVLEGHLQSTVERFSATQGLVLVLQDTTEFSYKRDAPEELGVIHRQKRLKLMPMVVHNFEHNAVF